MTKQKVKTTGRKMSCGQCFDRNGRRLAYTLVSVAKVDGFEAGDGLKVSGQTKGRGFTGVMKRWGFAGGPRTHGQSDRQRAPGSIGQGTTPGRVHKGKKMAGRSGNQKMTLSNVVLLEVNTKNKTFLIKGLLPGGRKAPLLILRQEKVKQFVPLLKQGGALLFSPDAQAQIKEESQEESKEEKPTEEGKPVKADKDDKKEQDGN